MLASHISLRQMFLLRYVCTAPQKRYFHLYMWKNNKPFSSFQGNELALFVANIPQTNHFLQNKLVRNNKVDNVTSQESFLACLQKNCLNTNFLPVSGRK